MESIPEQAHGGGAAEPCDERAMLLPPFVLLRRRGKRDAACFEHEVLAIPLAVLVLVVCLVVWAERGRWR